MTLLRTASGSSYEIDFVNRTWKRTKHEPESSELRTEEGTFLLADRPEVGVRFNMLCDPLTQHVVARYISTSPVTEIVDNA
jgi:hypothetical protein